MAAVPPLPADFSLSEAFPNPFNSVTRMTCALPVDAKVSVCVYDLEGRLIEKLVDSELAAGRHTVSWDGAAAPSGVYFVQMRAAEFSSNRKVVLAK